MLRECLASRQYLGKDGGEGAGAVRERFPDAVLAGNVDGLAQVVGGQQGVHNVESPDEGLGDRSLLPGWSIHVEHALQDVLFQHHVTS